MPRPAGLNLVLVTTMAAATFALTVFGVLPNELIAEFGLTRTELGLLGTASSVMGALASQPIGRLADRIGARPATVLTLVIGGAALLAVASAPAIGLVFAAAALTGIGQAGGNPSTNKLISLYVPAGRQGVVTGIKQSGVQVGTFLGGLFLPVGAAALGWRPTVAICGLIPLVMAAATGRVIPADPPAGLTRPGGGARQAKLDRYIRVLAIYGFLIGAGGSAIFAFLSLFSQEVLGMTPRTAGQVVAVMGLAGIVARVGWARVAEHRLETGPALEIIAGLAVLAGAVLWISPVVGGWVVWPAALITGLSASAWNSVGMLAVIQKTSAGEAGRGSGVVLTGFLLGLGIGAPLFGYLVDRVGDYRSGWLIVMAVFAAGWLTMRLARD